MAPPDDIEDLDPGLARERTRLAWTRTAIAFAAVGGAILKTSVAAGLIVAALSLVIWGLSRIIPDAGAGGRPRQLLLVAITVIAVSIVALGVVLLGSR